MPCVRISRRPSIRLTPGRKAIRCHAGSFRPATGRAPTSRSRHGPLGRRLLGRDAARKMDTGNRLDDKIFLDRGVYHVAFAVHRQATGGRWHYVSLPVTVGLGRDADINAVRFDGDAPKWDQPAKAVTLFYPGQVELGACQQCQASRRRQRASGRSRQVPPQRSWSLPTMASRWSSTKRSGVNGC